MNANVVENGFCSACGRKYIDLVSGPCPSDDCPSNDVDERRFLRRDLINESLREGRKSLSEIARTVRSDEYERYGFSAHIYSRVY